MRFEGFLSLGWAASPIEKIELGVVLGSQLRFVGVLGASKSPAVSCSRKEVTSINSFWSLMNRVPIHTASMQ